MASMVATQQMYQAEKVGVYSRGGSGSGIKLIDVLGQLVLGAVLSVGEIEEGSETGVLVVLCVCGSGAQLGFKEDEIVHSVVVKSTWPAHAFSVSAAWTRGQFFWRLWTAAA